MRSSSKKTAPTRGGAVPFYRPCAGIIQIRFNGSAAHSRHLSPVTTERPDKLCTAESKVVKTAHGVNTQPLVEDRCPLLCVFQQKRQELPQSDTVVFRELVHDSRQILPCLLRIQISTREMKCDQIMHERPDIQSQGMLEVRSERLLSLDSYILPVRILVEKGPFFFLFQQL